MGVGWGGDLNCSPREESLVVIGRENHLLPGQWAPPSWRRCNLSIIESVQGEGFGVLAWLVL